MKHSLILILFTCLAWAGYGQDYPPEHSQILNDSAQNIYGPTTSRYFYEHDVFLNNDVLHPIDTVIQDFHRFGYVENHAFKYQDLGNIGTAIRPIYYQAPTTIGARPGFDVYDMYWDESKPRYFDTKSPYSNYGLGLGGNGRSTTNVVFSRNINPRWNFGFDFKGLFMDKQVQRAQKGDRVVRRYYYDFFTTYQTKDSLYRVFFSFRRASHEVAEYGGVMLQEDSTTKAYYYKNALPFLTDAESLDFRDGFHLYHQLRLANAFQLYHSFDTYYQRNKFLDIPANEPEDYYDHTEVDSTRTFDLTHFATLRNEAGIKGSLFKLYYNGYVALRQYSMEYPYLSSDSVNFKTRSSEFYLGGRIALRLDSLLDLSGHLEYLPPNRYRFDGTLNSDWFDVNLTQAQYAPSFFEMAYRGSHDYWINDFGDTHATTLNGEIKIDTRHFKVDPGLNFYVVQNYIFMKYGDYGQEQTVLPVQTSGYQTMTAPQLRLSVDFFRHVNFTGLGIYSRILKNAGDAFQVPDVFVNGELSYSNIFFNGNLEMQVGTEMHWMSPYYAPDYDVATQHFFVQHYFKVPSYPLVNLFFNAKLRKGRIFLRYSNLNQFFTKQGYMPTPRYRGVSYTVDFGFDWSFYD